MNAKKCRFGLVLAHAVLLGQVGCALLKPKPAGEVLKRTEPDLGREYYLYKPSVDRKDQRWPVLVLCHSFPLESPRSVITDWAPLAEEKGFLLLAPKLRSTANWPPKLEKQNKLQQQDEDAILKALQHVRGGLRIADDKVFIVGSKSGCRAAMFTGLRNANIFRSIALLQPRFDVLHTRVIKEFIDPYQRVFVLHRLGDFHGDQGKDCAAWLRDQHVAVEEKRTAARRDQHPNLAYQFMHHVMVKEPWIRINAFESTLPLRVKFHATTSFENEIYKYDWDFGDGARGVIAQPEHQYAQPGEYHVSLRIHPDRKHSYERKIRVFVPSDYRPTDSK